MTAVTVPGQESRSIPYQYGIKSWQHWCDKNNAELVVCDQLLFPLEELRINYHRYYAFDVLEHNEIDYDQILITDADCIIHPDTPNFFELTNNNYTVVRCVGDVDWMIRGIENYSKFLFDSQIFDFTKRYFNAGFQVVNKKHRYLWDKMIKFYFDNKDTIIALQKQYGNGVDQVLVNMIVNLELGDSEMTYLPYEYCAADMHRLEILQDYRFIKCFAGIYQFNAIPGNHNDVYTTLMRTTYELLYKNKE